jgi:hypothetical protein
MNSSKASSRLIFPGTLATITLATITLVGSFIPSLGFADMFERSIYAKCGRKCGSEASMSQFWSSSNEGASGNRMPSGSCSFVYSISLNHPSASVIQGTNTSLTISVSLTRGVAGPVDLSIGQILDGLKVGLNPSSWKPPFDSKLTISAGPTSPIGSFTIIVTGSSPTAGVQTASLSLTVSQAVRDVAVIDLKARLLGG